MSRNNFNDNFKGLIYSMLTAIMTGMALALLAILIFKYFSRPYIANENDLKSKEEIEIEEIPVSFSRISNSIIYPPNDKKEIKFNNINPNAFLKDITAKCLGRTPNKLTNALATIEALKKLRPRTPHVRPSVETIKTPIHATS